MRSFQSIRCLGSPPSNPVSCLGSAILSLVKSNLKQVIQLSRFKFNYSIHQSLSLSPGHYPSGFRLPDSRPGEKVLWITTAQKGETPESWKVKNCQVLKRVTFSVSRKIKTPSAHQFDGQEFVILDFNCR